MDDLWKINQPHNPPSPSNGGALHPWCCYLWSPQWKSSFARDNVSGRWNNCYLSETESNHVKNINWTGVSETGPLMVMSYISIGEAIPSNIRVLHLPNRLNFFTGEQSSLMRKSLQGPHDENVLLPNMTNFANILFLKPTLPSHLESDLLLLAFFPAWMRMFNRRFSKAAITWRCTRSLWRFTVSHHTLGKMESIPSMLVISIHVVIEQ